MKTFTKVMVLVLVFAVAFPACAQQQIKKKYISNVGTLSFDWVDSEIADTLTLGSGSTVDDGALSANIGLLDSVANITGDWVNTTNPWADNEVSDTLTIDLNSTIDKGALADSGTLGFDWDDSEIEDTLTIGSGSTVDDGALSANVPLINAANNWTASNDFIGTVPQITAGQDDLEHAELYLYGETASNIGGELRVYNGANSDSVVDYYTLLSLGGVLTLGPNINQNLMTIDGINDYVIIETLANSTIDSSNTIADGALSANIGLLDSVANITGNWVNTTNPWVDDEISPTLTIDSDSTVDDGALSSNVPLKNGANNFTNSNNFRSITSFGADDSQQGINYLYGHGTGSTSGGLMRIYMADDHDTGVAGEYYAIQVISDDLWIGSNADLDAMVLDSNSNLSVGSGVSPAARIHATVGSAGADIAKFEDTAQTGAPFLIIDAPAANTINIMSSVGDTLRLNANGDDDTGFFINLTGSLIPSDNATQNIGNSAAFLDDFFINGQIITNADLDLLLDRDDNGDNNFEILEGGGAVIAEFAEDGDMGVFHDVTGEDVIWRIDNDSDTAGADAENRITTGGISAGDAFTEYQIFGVTIWNAGIDNSDSDKYKIGNDNFASNAVSIAPASFLTTFFGSLITSQGLIQNTTRITTTPYAVLSTDEILFINTDGGDRTVNLPAGVEGTHYRIINSGSSGNDVIIAPNGAEDLLGANSTFTLFDGDAMELNYNATDGWY